MKLSKAIEGYLLFANTKYAPDTVRHYQDTLRNVISHLGDPEIENISAEVLQKYFHYLKTEHKPHRFRAPGETATLMGDAGVEGYWKALRSLFKWSEEALRTSRPDKAIPQPKYQLDMIKAFTREEIEKLIYHAEWTNRIDTASKKTHRLHRPTYKRDVALIKFLLDTGLRLGEVCRVKNRDVDLQTGAVIVAPYGTGQKTKPRTVYLGKSSTHSLWVYLAEKDLQKEDSLFGSKGKTIRRLIKSIGDKAGVQDCHPHRFRHTFAIEFLRNQKDPYMLMRLLGHSNMEMTKHYLDIVEDDLRRVHGTASPVDKMIL